VILVGLTILEATVVLLAGEDITRWLARVAGLGAAEQSMLLAVQFVVAVTLLILVAALSYRFLPDCRQSFRHCFAAGVLTTALWILVTLAFRTYVQNFGNYNKTYGTIGGVIVLLTWMYFSMLVFLVGGEVASELHRGTGSVEPRHGALVGDRIETAVATDLASTDRIERLEPLRPRSV
jgi:membrane protein